ncbi:MAG: 50S ribosomal protein L30 [Actinomycetota bacterium]|nr:50S ribosomal protein L30 [Actinomycetota bacterium]
MSRIRITQVRSPVSRQRDQGRTLKALGLRRMNDSVEHERVPEVLGMVRKVVHLVKVEEIEGSK